MKSLVAILFLINCLAFFMYSHLQKQSELKSDQALKERNLPLETPQPIVLLSELSVDQLQALSPDTEEAAESLGEQSTMDLTPSEIER